MVVKSTGYSAFTCRLTTVYDSSSGSSEPVFWFPWALHIHRTLVYMQPKHCYMQKKKIKYIFLKRVHKGPERIQGR